MIKRLCSYFIFLTIANAATVYKRRPRLHRRHLDPSLLNDDWFGRRPDPADGPRGIYNLPCVVGPDEDDLNVDCGSLPAENSNCVSRMMATLRKSCTYPGESAPCFRILNCKKGDPLCNGVDSYYDYDAKSIVHPAEMFHLAFELCINHDNPYPHAKEFCCATKECRQKCYPTKLF
ncbi:unnamed protein product [Bursaphelenchus okinawaensis]|uniref:Uncharacterized protein n=1 Tax=Bursaphelenchus okinawaensis TaxID=465554 RepID=A0A811KM51_9BILA|nr:unnamed protein product [Bursaphelenchus okinawaensis]CAG9106423.1 unnamed protein product [Bursaphelenchus okinawaensis]